MRFVLKHLGRPVTRFKTTEELARAFRDSVKGAVKTSLSYSDPNVILGHRQAWEDAGVLHRDISVGNILIVDDPEEDEFVGFIHDFDYSSMTDAAPKEQSSTGKDEPSDELADSSLNETNKDLKERTVSDVVIRMILL